MSFKARLTVILALYFYPHAAAGQDFSQILEESGEQSATKQRTLSSADIGKLASSLGIKTNHPLITAILQQRRHPGPGAAHAVSTQEDGEPKRILKHVRGTTGIRYPLRSEQNLPVMPTREQLRLLRPEMERKAAEQAKERREVATLPKCSLNESTSVAHAALADSIATTESSADSGESTRDLKILNDVRAMLGQAEKQESSSNDPITIDLLFVNDSFETKDPKQEFGKHTRIKRYRVAKPTPGTYMAKLLRIPCLPFRIRQSDEKIFLHAGKDALRNFDDDPYGTGELRIEAQER